MWCRLPAAVQCLSAGRHRRYHLQPSSNLSPPNSPYRPREVVREGLPTQNECYYKASFSSQPDKSYRVSSALRLPRQSPCQKHVQGICQTKMFSIKMATRKYDTARTSDQIAEARVNMHATNMGARNQTSRQHARTSDNIADRRATWEPAIKSLRHVQNGVSDTIAENCGKRSNH